MYGNKLARNQSFSWIFAQKLFNGVGHHYVVQTIKTVICQLFLAAKSILNIWHQCVTLAIKAPVCQLFYGINISSSIIIWSSCSCCCCSCSSLFSRLSLKSAIVDRFWSSMCLNYCIDVPDKIGSFSSGAITSMVVKNGTQKNFWVFFWFKTCLTEIALAPSFLNIPENCWKNIILGTHGNVFCVIHFMGQILISKWLIFSVGTLSKNWHFGCKLLNKRQW